MIEPRRFGVIDLFLLVALMAGAGAVRSWYLLVCCDQGSTEGAYGVQDSWSVERDSLLHNLKAGTFAAKAPLSLEEETTAHTSVVYPWLLTQLDRPLDNQDATFQMARWIQAGLGGITVGLYFLIARRAFHSRIAGILAGILCALHPFWIISTAEINDGVLATFGLALCVFLGVRAGQSGGALTSLLYGLGLAGLAMIRPALLPFAFAAALWFLWRCRFLPRGWFYALLAFLGFVNGLLPWTARNYQLFGEAVPLVDSTFLHLWIGNNPKATGGPFTEAEMLELLGERYRGADELKHYLEKRQPERYRDLAPEMEREITEHPADTLERRLQAGLAFLLGDRWRLDRALAREDADLVKKVPWWLADSARGILVGSLLAMLLLGFLGWRWSYGWRHGALPLSLAPLWIFLPYFLGHADSLHGPRLPLDGILWCYAALVLACLVPSETHSLLHGEEVRERE